MEQPHLCAFHDVLCCLPSNSMLFITSCFSFQHFVGVVFLSNPFKKLLFHGLLLPIWCYMVFLFPVFPSFNLLLYVPVVSYTALLAVVSWWVHSQCGLLYYLPHIMCAFQDIQPLLLDVLLLTFHVLLCLSLCSMLNNLLVVVYLLVFVVSSSVAYHNMVLCDVKISYV